MDERLTTLLADARGRFADLGETVEEFGQTSVDVPAARLTEVATWLRDEGPFELLADWSCVDYLGEHEPRFLVAAHLASPSHASRLRLRVWLDDAQPCPSLTSVWTGANAQEREIYDFFGITFEGHPDLRRAFMPEEWEGHPQRKDYPLGGKNVEYHGAFIPAPDLRQKVAKTSGYPGRHA